MQFNELLLQAGIPPVSVAVMLHSPVDAIGKRTLRALVDDDPELFEIYQDNHPRNAEATLKRRAHAASFVCEEADDARFVGLYQVAGWTEQTRAEMAADPKRVALDALIPGSGLGNDGEAGRAIFRLEPLDVLGTLRGRLIVRRTAGRAYMRLAENNRLDVVEIARQGSFTPPAPDWTDFIISGTALRMLPKDWAARLREWRGIYLIVDSVDGARYVGSAYGDTNLLGRWRAHVAGDAGITAELKFRNPMNFTFSILERVSPDMPADAVTSLEHTWMRRLHTKQFGLNS